MLSKLFPLCMAAALLLSIETHARNWAKDAEALKFDIKPKNDQVTVIPGKDDTGEGMVINFAVGSDSYPGVYLRPQGKEFWDLSDFTCVEFKLTYQGEKPTYLTVRVGNEGHWKEKTYNQDARRFKPGDTHLIRVFFGYSHRKAAFPLDTTKVSNLLIFTGKASDGQSILVESIQATKFPVPFKKQITPIDGYVMGNPDGKDPAKQYERKNGAAVEGGAEGQPLAITFFGANQSVDIKPAGNGEWNLRDGYKLVAKIKNVGNSNASPQIQVVSGKGKTDIAKPSKPIASGKTEEVILSFIPAKPTIVGSKKKNSFESNKAHAIVISSGDMSGTQKFEIESIQLTAPAITLPTWVGKRPPVKGDWVMTYDESFDAETIDLSKWNIYGSNWYDKISRFSKNNFSLEDGNAVLLFEKKAGPHNDDPNHPRSNNYSTGYIDTYGKWVQRYGYFEARMKLPDADGLWPAFWLMPDRGLDAGEQWRRANTKDGGMEFDIMEHLSGWGPYRFTTAYHYDGYDDDHKAAGAGAYTAHDKEGYITTGLLWLPGLAVVYNNGKEISRWETDRISTVESNIIFTFVAGGWDNTGLNDKQLPAEFEIDYVRAWQRTDLASDVDGVQSTQWTPIAPTTPDA